MRMTVLGTLIVLKFAVGQKFKFLSENCSKFGLRQRAEFLARYCSA